HQSSLRFYVDEYRLATRRQHGESSVRAGVGGDDYATTANADRTESEQKSIAATRHTDRVLHTQGLSKLAHECLNLSTQDKPASLHDSPQREDRCLCQIRAPPGEVIDRLWERCSHLLLGGLVSQRHNK